MEKLVSVPVVTYNASKFVIETLESIYNQTYANLELIVSDDCSKDNTVELVGDWCAQPRVRERFTSIQIITVPKNTGVSANCNRSIAASAAEWIKFIAGDDILYPNCIADNMAFVAEKPEAKIIFSQVEVFQDDFDQKKYIKTIPAAFPSNLMDEQLKASDQYKILLLSDRMQYTPSYFFNKEAILKVGGYDETNRLVEDYPMWLKLTGSGEQLHYFHKATVGYRIHSAATNNSDENVIFKPSALNSFAVREKFAHPHLPWEIVQSEKHIYNVTKLFHKMGWNKKGKLAETAYRIFSFYLNPFYYVYSVKKRMNSSKTNTFYN